MWMNHRRRTIAIRTVLLLFITTLFLLEPFRLWWGRHGFGHGSVRQTAPPVTVLPPPSVMGDKWIKEHAPSLLTQDQLQSLYESLIQKLLCPTNGLVFEFSANERHPARPAVGYL